MKFFFKLLVRLFLLLLVLAAVLFLSWDWIVKKVAEHRISAVTGMEAHFDKFYVGVAHPVIQIENFKLYNPAEFGGAPLVDIPELHIEYDAAALKDRKVRIKLLRLNLAEVNLVRSAAGQTNINVLRDRLAAQKTKAQSAGGKKMEDKGATAVQLAFEKIDMLNLTLGKLRYTDLAQPANNREADLGVRNQLFQNLKTEEDLYGMGFVLLLKCGPELMEQFSGQLQGLAGGGAKKMKQAEEKVRTLIKK